MKARYEQFKEKHEAWDVEGFTIGHLQEVWYFRQVCCSSFLSGGNDTIEMLKERKYPQLKEPLIAKLYAVDESLLDVQRSRHTRFATSKADAIVLLDMLDGWLGANNNLYAIGTDDYSLADVIATVFVHPLVGKAVSCNF